MMKANEGYKKREELISKLSDLNLEEKKVEMSPEEKMISKFGDKDQA